MNTRSSCIGDQAARRVASITRWLVALTLAVTVSASVLAGSTHVYDESGRLRTITDAATGETGEYQYDPLGNVLRVNRYAAAELALFEFAPSSAPVNALITLHGSGFSAVAANNVVKFGTAVATVTSASVHTLVVKVPAGAAGKISVTVGGVTVLSANNFSLTGQAEVSGGPDKDEPALSSPPTINALVPRYVVSGTQVTISGTNFQDLTRVKLNGVQVAPTTATASYLRFNVPAHAGSGRVEVTTAWGTVTSADDIYVAPEPNAATTIASASRTTINSPDKVVPVTAGKIGLLLFDGIQGQPLTVALRNVSLTEALVTVLTPLGYTLASKTVGAGGEVVALTPLPASGTYTIVVDPIGNNAGNVSVAVLAYKAIWLAPGAGSAVVSTARKGQGIQGLFPSSVGDIYGFRFALTAKNPSGANGFDFQVRDSSGLILRNFGGHSQLNAMYYYEFEVPNIGPDSVFFIPNSSETTASVEIGAGKYIFANVQAPISVSAPRSWIAAVLPINVAAFRVNFQSPNERISLKASDGTFSSPPDVRIYNPTDAGAPSLSNGVLHHNWNFVNGTRDEIKLGAAGTYTIALDPDGEDTGSVRITLDSILADVFLTPNLPFPASASSPTSRTMGTTDAGQRAVLCFVSSIQGARVALMGSESTFPNRPDIRIYYPAGNCVDSRSKGVLHHNWNFGSGSRDEITLGAAGTYAIELDPDGEDTGSVRITLDSILADVFLTPNLPFPASASSPTSRTMGTTDAGQRAVLCFVSSIQGVHVTLSGSENTFPNLPDVRIYYPAGNCAESRSKGVLHHNWNFGNGAQDEITLGDVGTYAIELDPDGEDIGSVKVTLGRLP